MMLAFLLSVGLYAPALASEVGEKPEPSYSQAPTETFGTYGPAAYGTPKPASPTISLTQALEHAPFARQVRLGPVDVDSLLAEDLQNAGLGTPPRIGIARPVQIGVDDGQWNPLPGGGGLWTLSLLAEGAAGVRLHFADFNLPPGAAIRLFSPENPQTVDGPFTAAGPFGDGEFWSTVIFGREVHLEYHDPAGAAAAAPASIPFAVDQMQHLYRNPLGTPCSIGQEGSCHVDVNCFPEWSDVADAVARYTFVDGGSYLCTGQLLDTLAHDLTPYLVTAWHCVHEDEVARTVVCFWRFQTATCNGTPPTPASVPKSSRARQVADDEANDSSLLMVLGELPPGLFWAGWSTNAVADDTPSSCIHHPCGSHKRISRGRAFEDSGFLRLDWESGVTEGFSSGGGAYLDSTQQLVGVLSGGPSYCGAEPWEQFDYFGEFRHAYAVLAPFLQAGSDDLWEPSAPCAAAPLVPPGFHYDLVVKSTNEDWYRLHSTGCGDLGVTLMFTDAHGDIDMELYDACGGNVVAASLGAGNNESLTYSPGSAGDYWLRVFLNSNTRNTYDMRVTHNGVSFVYPNVAGELIPDNNPAGIEESFFVPDYFTVADLDLGVHITHSFNGDLAVQLRHGATTVTLIDRPGLPPPPFGFLDDGFDVVLHDDAVMPIEYYTNGGPMVIGNFRPNQLLAPFIGMEAHGTWILKVSDNERFDLGRLEQWTLFFRPELPPGEPCECGGSGDPNGDGNTDLADIGAFQRCFTGSGAGSVPSGCDDLEFDCDTDVDIEDWTHLVSVLTGPRRSGGGSGGPPKEHPIPQEGTKNGTSDSTVYRR